MVLLYGRAGCLTAKNGGFRPGQNLVQGNHHELKAGMETAIAELDDRMLVRRIEHVYL
jgi:hypothetical protein